VLFIVGTIEMEGEIRLFDRKAIEPQDGGIAFFRPDDPIYALMLDHFVIRLVTPMVTLGGGQILDHLERFPRRRELDALDYLNMRLSARLEDFVQSELRKEIMVKAGELMINGDCSQTEVQDIIETLMKEKKVGQFGDYVYYFDYLAQAVERFTSALKEHLQDQSHVKGLTLENIGDLSPLRQKTTRLLLDYMLSENILVKQGELYNIAGRDMSLKGVIKQAHDEIMARLRENPSSPPSLSELASGGKNYQQAIKFILDTGEAHKCGSDFLFLTDTWNQIISYIREKLDRDGQMSVPDLRDQFLLTRKWVIPILEETDRQRLTERKGDIRIKGAAFEKKDTAL
jgi:selenocysteine-specific elongation factor